MIKQYLKYGFVFLCCLILSCQNEVTEKSAKSIPSIEKEKNSLDTINTVQSKEVKTPIRKMIDLKDKKVILKITAKLIDKTPTNDSLQGAEFVDDFNALMTIKSKAQIVADSLLEAQLIYTDTSLYGLTIGKSIPPFYFYNGLEKKYIYGIKSKYLLLYISNTPNYAYKEPFIDSLSKLWFQDTIYRKEVFTQHISLAISNNQMFSNDSIPGRLISNFKESYNNGGFNLKKLFNLNSMPSYFLIDSSKKIIAIQPNINIIQSFLKH